MVFDAIIELAAKALPISAMVRSLLENCLSAEILDDLFEEYRRCQYMRTLLFSTIVQLLSVVVCKVYPSMNAAVVAMHERLNVSDTSIWNKLNGTDPEVSAALVKTSAQRLGEIMDGLGSLPEPLLGGYRTRILDGNCIEASEHRLEPLRSIASGPLPGKVLAVLDPQRHLIVDIIPCLDGHAQERSLLPALFPLISAGDLWIADRNFCTTEFFAQASARSAAVIIREHKNLPWILAGEAVLADSSGKIFEEPIKIPTADGGYIHARRIVARLPKPTRDGDRHITLITTLPREHASAAQVLDLYAKRWTIETHFGMMSRALAAEIPTLGHPKAAILALAVGFVCANIIGLIHATLQAAHPNVNIDQSVSDIRIAEEVQRTYDGMVAMSGNDAWAPFQTFSAAMMVAWLLRCAANVALPRFRKSSRGPKKQGPPRSLYKNSPHVSTARLLQIQRVTK